MSTGGGHLTTQISSVLRHALETGDTTSLAKVLADDAVVWHNSDREELPKEAGLRRIEALTAMASEVRVEVKNHAETSSGFADQIVLRGVLTETGKKIELHNCLMVTVRDALVVRIDEYVDPNVATLVGRR
jgi:ketosteroid isomerase-like protein